MSDDRSIANNQNEQAMDVAETFILQTQELPLKTPESKTARFVKTGWTGVI